jgi:N-acyl-D-amino-acid deacylase
MSALFQGVTLEVVGNCGFGCAPIGRQDLAAGNIYGFSGHVPLGWHRLREYFARLEAARIGVNVLALVPNGQLRLACVGMSEAPADPAARAAMGQMLNEALDDGAFGYSTGLEYAPEAGATEEEIAGLLHVVAERGGIYATHTRARDVGAIAAIAEALRTAEKAGVRLQVSHLLPRSGPADGTRAIEIVDAARRRGLDVAFDMHTRRYGTTFLSSLLPPWIRKEPPSVIAAALCDGEQRKRMKEFRSILSASGDWERVVLLDNPHWPDYARRSLAEIGRLRDEDPHDAALDLLVPCVGDLTKPMVIIHCVTVAQQCEVFAHPLCMPGSDATTLATDGPLAGSAFHGAYTWAAWFWRFMVRETGLLSAEEAVFKLTGLPARTLRLRDRGALRPGARADVSVFDPALFGETATTFEPNRLANGMKHVFVNGAHTLRDGALTGVRGGEVIRRQ